MPTLYAIGAQVEIMYGGAIGTVGVVDENYQGADDVLVYVKMVWPGDDHPDIYAYRPRDLRPADSVRPVAEILSPR